VTSLGSLRARVVLGLLLWTVGIAGVGHVLSVALVHRLPRTLWLGHLILLSVVALGLLAAGLSQVRSGLSSLSQLRERLRATRAGRERGVGGVCPSEVQPLVDDLNALLDDRERRVERALAKAGDLAHGLKTPLAVLAHEAARAAAAGQGELAAAIEQQVTRMHRQVDYHLAQARAAESRAGGGACCAVAESAEGLARTMRHLHAGHGLAIEVDVAPGHAVRARREDVDEMLGNLLDNACKWARSRVTVQSAAAGGEVGIAVDDDGPGLTPQLRESVLRRGVRADEAAPGSGLGLAIVRDLAELHGGAIALEESPAGGVRARLRLPAA
jgi:signal transduction histidine kinase